jgi:GMP synthase (glutamine-hydrolysing)
MKKCIIMKALLSLLVATKCLSATTQRPHLLVVNNGKIEGSDLEKYLLGRKVSYIVVDKSSNIQDVMHYNFKGIILSGGPLMYSTGTVNIEFVNINFAAILNVECPVLGICFGHQTITELFGGKMGKLEQLAVGMQKVHVLKKVELFDGLPNEVVFKKFHYDCSTQIPYNFELIATSDVCYIEGIKHKTKPIFGIQFHPEGSDPYGYKLLDNFLRLCDCSFVTPEGQ